ncbi:SdpA family antimicrobial peptide system protein [Bacillus sp. REN3]|uniref:SdpA family antimicrobial peptide system protein n=1 Tax=Bacillus sp. REN3 TaxID=2802440 RepID=UPI001AEF0755|nr:SdpA family antimicrobial peptide system protein [Bacillus sp. REN3]
MDIDPRKSNKSLGLFFLTVSALWCILLFYTIIAAIPTSAIPLDLEKRILIRTVYPQGWGFYSKDPRGDMFNVYNISNEEPAVNWPNNKISNVFGLYRYGRAQGTEMGLLTAQIQEGDWDKCTKDPRDCLSDSTKTVSIQSTTPKPTLCGELGIASAQPIPWAWADYADDINSTSKIVRVNVSCSKN